MIRNVEIVLSRKTRSQSSLVTCHRSNHRFLLIKCSSVLRRPKKSGNCDFKIGRGSPSKGC